MFYLFMYSLTTLFLYSKYRILFWKSKTHIASEYSSPQSFSYSSFSSRASLFTTALFICFYLYSYSFFVSWFLYKSVIHMFFRSLHIIFTVETKHGILPLFRCLKENIPFFLFIDRCFNLRLFHLHSLDFSVI